MKYYLPLQDIDPGNRHLVGGKAAALARIQQAGIPVPETFCIPCPVYQAYLTDTGLDRIIHGRLNHSPLDTLRWEEFWDLSLRIRNHFLTTPMPQAMERDLLREITLGCKDRPVAVRSSAPGEDGENRSFAGVFDSFLNIKGPEEILKHIRLVWASLFSDAALLYRKEMELDTHNSTMAVVIQPLASSDRSGVFFSINPADDTQCALEAVHGLNQGLVDGDIEPDRWLLDRSTGRIDRHIRPTREKYAIPSRQGVRVVYLPRSLKNQPPLEDREVAEIWKMGTTLDHLFGQPQDVEWTFEAGRLVVLQSRPITGNASSDTDDKRSWYLSLHRSHDNLKALYDRIQNHLIPEMIEQSRTLAGTDLAGLDNPALAREIQSRQEIYDHWVRVYWDEFIPFAHGIRLFGHLYNDMVMPEDPYEFMRLLEKTDLKSVQRNRLMENMAGEIRQDPDLEALLAAGKPLPDGHSLKEMLERFVRMYGDLTCHAATPGTCREEIAPLIPLLLELAKKPGSPASGRVPDTDVSTLKERYLSAFSSERRIFGEKILTLGRESYRLRDDDNIHLGQIEARLFDAVQEGRKRLDQPDPAHGDPKELTDLPALATASDTPDNTRRYGGDDSTTEKRWFRSRQITGHPAGPGIASGPARVIHSPSELVSFKQGEVLVCRAVDPNMTFVIPLAAAVVEERGGMLIHGAIIAREYGLPCVTGAGGITRRIRTGDEITVDGYLGIVTSRTRPLDAPPD